MPGPLDLTNDRISFTYDRLVQTDGAGNFFNGLGDPIALGTVASVGATTPVTSTGGTNPVIGISQASAIDDGYISSEDWVNFSNPAPSIFMLMGG